MLTLLLAFMQASAPTPDSAAVRREARELQAQFELFRREHLPISEVAACLGIPTGTAKSRLNHALAQLRSGVADVPQVEALASGRTLA